MKHLQTGRCSITILGLQDIAEIFFAILFFVCCNLIFIARWPALIKEKLVVLKKLLSFRPPVLSELSCLHQTTIHACIVTTVYICIFYRHGFSIPQISLLWLCSMSFDLFCQNSCSNHSCFLKCPQNSPPISPTLLGTASSMLSRVGCPSSFFSSCCSSPD